MTGTEGDRYRQSLLDAGLLVATGEKGLYGRSGRFESVVAGIEGLVASAARVAGENPAVRRFAPVMPVDVLVRAGYPRSFPDLIGTVSTFTGGDKEHARLLGRLDSGEDWMADLEPAGTALCSAACQPLFPSLTGALPPGGSRFDVYGWVFRHEPSDDPARQQAFRQYEQVYVGEADRAVAHRDRWRDRAGELLSDLGLQVRTVPANDPFFGRLGRLMAESQREAEAKYEIVAPTGPDSPATAVASANFHGDHFGVHFAIRDGAGRPAHSACIGFGVERITLALVWAHGPDPAAWPPAVRARLWP